MTDDSAVLEWKNYSSTSRDAFQKLYDDIGFTDVTIACEDNQKIEAHKVILSTCSTFFSTILKENLNPHPLIYLQGVSIDDLALLKKFMYLGRATVLKSQLDSFKTISKAFLNSNRERTSSAVQTATVEYEPTIKREMDVSLHSGSFTETYSEGVISEDHATGVQETPETNIEQSHPSSFSNDHHEIPLESEIKNTQDKPLNQSQRAKLSCAKCDYTTFSNSKWISHTRKRHEQVCPTCKLELDNSDLLKKHIIQKHTMYTCESCSYSTKWRDSLYRHNKKHTGKMIRCGQCEYSCIKMDLLHIHMESKHSTSEYKCESCDFKTHTSRNIKFHDQKVHQGIRYYCEFCDFKATKQYNLRTHQLNIHAKIRYNCQLCEFGDSQKSRVKLHEQRKHSIF